MYLSVTLDLFTHIHGMLTFINKLTEKKTLALRIHLQRFSGEKGYAEYSKFALGDENSKY